MVKKYVGEVVAKDSPVESVEVIILELFSTKYRNRVVSTMSASSWSQFNGYDVSFPFANAIRVKLTQLFPDREVMCTRDLAYAETDRSLDSNFDPKEEYTVIVNKITQTFIAH